MDPSTSDVPRCLLPAIAWAALIFTLSAQPDFRFVPDVGLDRVVRKLGHMKVASCTEPHLMPSDNVKDAPGTVLGSWRGCSFAP